MTLRIGVGTTPLAELIPSNVRQPTSSACSRHRLALYSAHFPERNKDDEETSEAYFRKWRTWQMSDHRPLWIQIDTDFADRYLADFVNSPAG